MKHKHHVRPRYMGGPESPTILIDIEDHAIAHKMLYEEFGNQEDYIAWKALEGSIDKAEITRELCSLAGTKQGKINAENGHMTAIRSKVQMSPSEVGKLGAEVNRKNKTNAFFDPELKKEIARKGGKVQGRNNVTTGHLKKIANVYWENVKSGKVKRSKKKWITDGEKSVQIDYNSDIPLGWRRGRTLK